MDNVIIKEHFNRLLDQLSLLKELLLSIEPSYAEVALLPVALKNAETGVQKTITPTAFHDHEAVKLAANAYTDLYITAGASQKIAKRTPGLIWYDTDKITAATNIQPHIEAINKEKMSIKEHVVSNFKTADERYDILRQSCPGVMTLHLYRMIRCYNQTNLKSARLIWAQQDSIRRPHKQALLKQLNQALDASSCQAYVEKLTTIIKYVSLTPQSALRVRREVQPQPMANIVDANGKTSMVTAPMPIIVLQPLKPVLRSIGEFDLERASRRKKRADSLNKILLGNFQGTLIERVENTGKK